MVTLKLKKGIMRAANFIFFMLLNFSLVAQNPYLGEYSNSKGIKYKSLDLMQSNDFKFTSSVSGDSFISKGYYLIKNDTLLLFYDSLPSAYPPSKFSIMGKSDSIFREFGGAYKIKSDVAIINFIIQDYGGQPVKGCNISFMKSKKPVFGKVSDENGKADVFIQGKIIESIAFYFIGYKPIWVEMKNFWGFKSTLKVNLGKESNIRYNKNYKIEKYLVRKLKNGNISFIPINSQNLEALIKN